MWRDRSDLQAEENDEGEDGGNGRDEASKIAQQVGMGGEDESTNQEAGGNGNEGEEESVGWFQVMVGHGFRQE